MAATESIRALRENPHVFSQGVGSLFGLPEEDEEDCSPFGMDTFQDNLFKCDDVYLEDVMKVLKKAASLQAERRSMEAFNLMARSSVDFARIAECLTNSPTSEAAQALVLELGTKSGVNLLRQAREDAEATTSIRHMADAALKVLRADRQLSAADRAHCVANFATLHGYLRDWKTQKGLCEEVLEMQASCIPADDPDVVRMKQHLGVACLNLGEWSTARRLSEEVLEVQLQQLGPFHVDVAWTKRHLGVACGSLGDKASSKRLCLEALDILRSPLDFNSLEVARMLRSLGVALGNLGDWKMQRDLCQEAQKYFQESFGDDHIDTAMTKRHLGTAMARLNPGLSDADAAAARVLCRDAFNVLQQHLGDAHLDVARARCAWAECCDPAEPGGSETQRELFESALEVLVPQLGAEHLEVARARMGLGAALGDAAEARRLCSEALSVLQRALGDDDVEVAWAKNIISKATLQLGGSPSEMMDAEHQLQEANSVLQRLAGPQALDVATGSGPMRGRISGCFGGCWPSTAGG